jgi:hypothetical protein
VVWFVIVRPSYGLSFAELAVIAESFAWFGEAMYFAWLAIRKDRARRDSKDSAAKPVRSWAQALAWPLAWSLVANGASVLVGTQVREWVPWF